MGHVYGTRLRPEDHEYASRCSEEVVHTWVGLEPMSRVGFHEEMARYAKLRRRKLGWWQRTSLKQRLRKCPCGDKLTSLGTRLCEGYPLSLSLLPFATGLSGRCIGLERVVKSGL